MVDRAPALDDLTAARIRWRLGLVVAAVVAWLVAFAILLRLGTWSPFAFVGPALAALALRFDAATATLLRPSWRHLALGIAAGLIMVALTHAAFALVAPSLPAVMPATRQLYDLLNVGGFSPAARAALIVVIATCEEIVFRGAVMGPTAGRRAGLFHAVDRTDLRRVVVSAAAYTVAMATLASGLLLAAAFGCALIWGGLRVATRSLVVPILAHVVWDLGVLVVWPMVHPRG